jgi:hypothetical protein
VAKEGCIVRIIDRATGVKGDKSDIVYKIVNGRAGEVSVDRSGEVNWCKVSVVDGDQKSTEGWVPVRHLGLIGRVKNNSTKVLWVVETETGKPIAHKLAPGRRSPKGLDADGLRAVDGTPVDGHTSWIKVYDTATADVADNGKQLTAGCILCIRVGESEFGIVVFDNSDGWGEPIDQ